MAGDIDEEPFRLNFKLEGLNSGSISFGRFEKEGLSWERRSSFSRNRYLEEIEKYSKPGSVTEKKAILEAHFKKRALLSHSSSEWQRETSENNVSKNTGYDGDFEHFNGGGYSLNFSDDGPYGSSNDREPELTERESEDGGTSNLHTVDNKDGSISSVPKIRSASQTKHLKPRSVYRANNTVKANSSISREGSNSKDIFRKPTRRESDVSLRPKREKLSLESVTASTSRSISRTLKHEVSTLESAATSTSKHKASYGSRAKILNYWKSSSIAKESRTGLQEKVAPSMHQNANRHTQASSSTKPDMKRNGSGFSFRSEERAERRKQFSMKLEEKMNAKGAEMLQIQKKMEIETRQLRRSLNFKATPLPSFYHEARPLPDKTKTSASKSTTSNTHPAHPRADSRGTRKNNQEKKQLTSSLKQRALGVNKANRAHNVEVKRKAIAGRTDLYI